MAAYFNNKPQRSPNVKSRAHNEDGRQRAEKILRELAFVLKMTQTIREEIEAEQETEELVLV